MKPFNCVKKTTILGSFKNICKMYLKIIHLICMYEKVLALNNLQRLISLTKLKPKWNDFLLSFYAFIFLLFVSFLSIYLYWKVKEIWLKFFLVTWTPARISRMFFGSWSGALVAYLNSNINTSIKIFFSSLDHYNCSPVGWVCRIHRLHLWRWVRLPQWVSWIWY